MILLALTTSVLITIWVIVYICCIYHSPDGQVWVGSGERAEDGQEETNYSKQSKTQYLIIFLILPVLNIPYFIYHYFDTKDWVKRNEKYRRST